MDKPGTVFENSRKDLFPADDEDITALKKDFKAYCATLKTEDDNAGNVYEAWIDRKSDLLSGKTPFEFIKSYAGDPPSFERYERLVISMLSDGVYSLPGKVLSDFFASCGSEKAWRTQTALRCLGELTGDDPDAFERCFMILYKLSELPGGFPEDLYGHLVRTAGELMDKNEEYGEELLSIAVLACENGFEKTVAALSEKNDANETFGPVETKLLSVLCFSGRKDERLYRTLRSLVKRTDMFDSEIRFYFTLVRDYGDPRAVSFLRTKVNLMREAYMGIDSGSEAAKALFDNAFYGDSVVRELGGGGLF